MVTKQLDTFLIINAFNNKYVIINIFNIILKNGI